MLARHWRYPVYILLGLILFLAAGPPQSEAAKPELQPFPAKSRESARRVIPPRAQIGWQRREISVGKLRYTGQRLDLTPREIATGTLGYTGQRLDLTPQEISTGTLRYRGPSATLPRKDTLRPARKGLRLK